MKLLITGTLLVVVAAAANLDAVRQGEQLFQRTPNNNLVQVKYIDNSRFATSQPFNRQSQRSGQRAQVRSFSGNNQGFFSNQNSQFDQQGGNFQQNQRNQFTTSFQNQRNRFSDNSQNQRNQFSGNFNRHSSSQQFSFNNNQHRNPHLVDVSFIGDQQNRNAQNQGQFLSRGFNQNQQSRDFFSQFQNDRQFQGQNREFFGQNQQNRDFFNQNQQNEFLNQNNRNFVSQQNDNSQFFRSGQNQGEQVFHVTTSGQHQLQRQIGGPLNNQEHFSRSFGFSNNNNERREVSGHIQTDAGQILGVFQSFFVPASATLAEGLISSSFTCENYGRGYYTDPDNSCRYFHVCSPVRDPLSTQSSNNFYRFTFQCGDDEQFDQERMTCVRNELTNACPNARSFFSFSQDRSRNLFTSFPDSSFNGDYFYIGDNGIVTGIRRK